MVNDDALKNVDPFFRMIIGNVLSVITAIHSNATSEYSLQVKIHEKFTMKIYKSYRNKDNIKKHPAYALYSTLPIQFRMPNPVNGCCFGLTLPKAERLVEYMLSEKFKRVMWDLFYKGEELVEQDTQNGIHSAC